MSHQKRSITPCAARSHFHRRAIGSAVTIMIVTASPNHQRFADLSVSHVCSRSILSRMYAVASAVSVTPIRIRKGRFTCEIRGTRGVFMR